MEYFKISERGYGKSYFERTKKLKMIKEEFLLQGYIFNFYENEKNFRIDLTNKKDKSTMFYTIDNKVLDNITSENQIIGYVADVIQNITLLNENFDKIYNDNEDEGSEI